MTGLVYEDPPNAATAGRRQPRTEWDAITADLRAHPGKWAVIRRSTIGKGLASRITTGRAAAFRPAGHYEGRTAKVGVDGQGRALMDVYARYIGPPITAQPDEPQQPTRDPVAAPGNALRPARADALLGAALRDRPCTSTRPHPAHTWDHGGRPEGGKKPLRDHCPGTADIRITAAPLATGGHIARPASTSTGGGLVVPALVRAAPGAPARPIEYPPGPRNLDVAPPPTDPAVLAAMALFCTCGHSARVHGAALADCAMTDCGCAVYRRVKA